MPSLAPDLPPSCPADALADPAARPCRSRCLADYVHDFSLDLAALRGRDVLDVGAGASSFVAEACGRRIDAVAVDPIYDRPPTELAAWVARAGESGAGRPPAGVAAPGAEPRSPAERFLADYESGFCRGRYVWGGLPQLPFFDGTFDLVLCAVLPPATGDGEALLAACRELVRVSAGEARLRPATGPAGRLPNLWARLRRELRAGGIASETSAAGGGHPLLVLRRNAS